ncbi:hypothetical protein GEMRC1_004295 [Eukaryota sp. GEM-RC1]
MEHKFKLSCDAKRQSAERQLRFKHLELKEQRSLALLKALQSSREDALTHLDQRAQDLRRSNNYAVESRAEEEELRRAELNSLQREIEREAKIVEESHGKQMSFMIDQAAKTREETRQDVVAKLEAEDKARAIRLNAARQRRQVSRDEALKAQDQLQIEQSLMEAELERRAMERKLDAESRVRQVETEEYILTEQSWEQAKDREELKRKQEEHNLRNILEQRTQFHTDLAKERRELLENDKKRRALELEKQAERLRDAESELRSSQWELAIREELKIATEAEDKEEDRLKDVLLEFDAGRRKDQMKLVDLERAQAELKNRLDFERELLKEASDVRQQERDQFERFRRDLRSRTDAELGEMYKRHSEALNILRVERERKLLDLPEDERRRVYREMLPKLEAERERLSKMIEETAHEHQSLLQRAAVSPTATSSPSVDTSPSLTSPEYTSSASVSSSPLRNVQLPDTFPSTSPFQQIDLTTSSESHTSFRPQRVTLPSDSSTLDRNLRRNVGPPRHFLGSQVSSTSTDRTTEDSFTIHQEVHRSRFLEKLKVKLNKLSIMLSPCLL